MASANAVVVSADLEAQQALASLLGKCGLAPVTASTVGGGNHSEPGLNLRVSLF